MRGSFVSIGCLIVGAGCQALSGPPDYSAVFDGSGGDWIDLTYTFSEETIYWPTGDGFRLEEVAYGETELGYFYSAYNISTASTIAPISDGGDDDTVTVDLNVRVADANTTYDVTVVGNDVTLTNAANGESQTITMTDLTGDGSTQTLSFDLLGVDVNLTLNQGATGDGTVSAADIAAGLDGSSVVTTGDTATSTLRVGDQPGDDISVSFDGQILARTLGSGPTENLADLIRDNQAVATVGEADTLLDSIDAAIGQVSAERARLGGSENQLGYAINSQSSRVFNLTAAESRIRDVDFAAETTRLSSLQIQQQALIALLVQANSMSKSVLSLIG